MHPHAREQCMTALSLHTCTFAADDMQARFWPVMMCYFIWLNTQSSKTLLRPPCCFILVKFAWDILQRVPLARKLNSLQGKLWLRNIP